MNHSVVYVVGIVDNPVKIGVAADMASRLTALQVGCPDDLTVFYTQPSISSAAHELEGAVHKELDQHHRRGEWFNVSARDAAETIKRQAATIDCYHRIDLRAGGDLLDRIASEHPIPRSARVTLRWYQITAKNEQTLAKTRAKRAELKVARAGPIAANLFRLAFVEGREHLDVTMARDWRMARKIRIELARAIIELCRPDEEAPIDKIHEKAA